MSVALADDHVAAVAAAPLEIAAAGSAFLDRRDHLDEIIADWQQRIFQPEHSDSGIDVTDLESEHALQIIDHRRELVGDQRNLAKLNRHRVLLSTALLGTSTICSGSQMKHLLPVGSFRQNHFFWRSRGFAGVSC